MGSTGSGNFSDYSGTNLNRNGSGGGNDENECGKAFSAEVEEVANNDYYKNNGLPSIGVSCVISAKKRIEVWINEELLGYLPTEFNYLLACLNDGYSYLGFVEHASEDKYPRVNIDVSPVE